MQLVDRLGFDAVDAGPLDAGVALQPGGPIFGIGRSADELTKLPMRSATMPRAERCCDRAMQQNSFITGSSRGLGHALARAAFDAGDLVAATDREPTQLDDLLAEYGEHVQAIALDVTDAHAARSAIAEARRRSAAWTSSSTTPATPTSRPSRPPTTRTSTPSSRPTSGRVPRLEGGDPSPAGAREWPGHADLVGQGPRRRSPENATTRPPSSPSTASVGCCEPRPRRSA